MKFLRLAFMPLGLCVLFSQPLVALVTPANGPRVHLDSIGNAPWADQRTRELAKECSDTFAKVESTLPEYFRCLLHSTLSADLGNLASAASSSFKTIEYHKVMTDRELARITGRLIMFNLDELSEPDSLANVASFQKLNAQFAQSLVDDPIARNVPEASRSLLIQQISDQLESCDFFSVVHSRKLSLIHI